MQRDTVGGYIALGQGFFLVSKARVSGKCEALSSCSRSSSVP